MHKPQATLPPLRRLRVITYRVTLDVPLQLVIKVSNLLRKRRKEVPILADSGYEGAGAGVLVPVKKPRNGELDINTKTRNMLLRGARYQGERAFALMSQRWRAIRHVSADPSQIGDIAKSVLVLTQFEHKMIS